MLRRGLALSKLPVRRLNHVHQFPKRSLSKYKPRESAPTRKPPKTLSERFKDNVHKWLPTKLVDAVTKYGYFFVGYWFGSYLLSYLAAFATVKYAGREYIRRGLDYVGIGPYLPEWAKSDPMLALGITEVTEYGRLPLVLLTTPAALRTYRRLMKRG